MHLKIELENRIEAIERNIKHIEKDSGADIYGKSVLSEIEKRKIDSFEKDIEKIEKKDLSSPRMITVVID